MKRSQAHSQRFSEEPQGSIPQLKQPFATKKVQYSISTAIRGGARGNITMESQKGHGDIFFRGLLWRYLAICFAFSRNILRSLAMFFALLLFFHSPDNCLFPLSWPGQRHKMDQLVELYFELGMLILLNGHIHICSIINS